MKTRQELIKAQCKIWAAEYEDYLERTACSTSPTTQASQTSNESTLTDTVKGYQDGHETSETGLTKKASSTGQPSTKKPPRVIIPNRGG